MAEEQKVSKSKGEEIQDLLKDTIDLAKQTEESWVEFFLNVEKLQVGLVGKLRYYEILGYETWRELRDELILKSRKRRAQFLACLRAVGALNLNEVRALGATRSIQASRLVKAGLWNISWFNRLKEMSADEATLAVREAIREKLGKLDESHTTVRISLLKSQKELLDEIQRTFVLSQATESSELFWDFVLSTALAELQSISPKVEAEEVSPLIEQESGVTGLRDE